MDLKIDYSDFSTSSTIINDLMKIEADVYLPEYQGDFISIERRLTSLKICLFLHMMVQKS